MPPMKIQIIQKDTINKKFQAKGKYVSEMKPRVKPVCRITYVEPPSDQSKEENAIIYKSHRPMR